MTIIATGIDLAKHVFAVHGVNATGVVQLREPKVARSKLQALIAALPPGVIGMEVCSGAHHWARQFQAHGHTVRLMAPKLVTPYRMSGKRGKNDAADAEPGREQSSGLFSPGKGSGHWPDAPCKGRRSARRCSDPPCASFRSRPRSSRHS